MASKFNSEFNYRYQVKGETPWEKIKTLKGFLEGRLSAAMLEDVTKLRDQAAEKKIQYLKDTGAPEYEILIAEKEKLEIASHLATEKDAFELNKLEIDMLGQLLAELYLIVEPTRVPGYTDEQMFELNAANEFTAMIAKEIYTEILTVGRPSPAKLHNAMSNPHTFKALQVAGLIPQDMAYLEGGVDPLQIGLKLTPPDQLTYTPPSVLSLEAKPS
jgi:hypothetical protein